MIVAWMKPEESFRGDYAFSNSPQAIARFPFPFDRDSYMYAVNIEPHAPGPKGSVYEFAFDLDEHYGAECLERRRVLEEDPGRCVALPHMMFAQWDTLRLIMESFARDYPDLFSLHKTGDRWTWINRPLSIRDDFRFGDEASLPCGPLEYVTRQAQGDFVIMDQRDGDLWADAGMVTGPADWSLAFDAGMSFREWHGPVPRAHEIGVFDRALKFLTNLRQGAPVRRLNWTMTIHPHLDTSPETYDRWGPARTTVTPANVGRTAHLRVELQALFRLPRSNGILFSIRTYMLRLDELATNRAWARRFHRVLKTLPDDLADYKGLSRYRRTVIDFLAPFDDPA